MELKSSSKNIHENITLDLLVKEINKHAATQGYAVVKGRIKRFKQGVVMKTWITCDRGGEAKNESHGHRRTFSRRNQCQFSCVAKLKDNIENEHEFV